MAGLWRVSLAWFETAPVRHPSQPAPAQAVLQVVDPLFELLQSHPRVLWGLLIFGAPALTTLAVLHRARPRRALSTSLLAGAAALVVVWFAGRHEANPRFELDPHDPGQVVAVGQSWLGRLSDHLRGRRYLVLSFDDGPSDPRTDRRILRILARHHAHALFFSVCDRALSPAGRQALRDDVAAGDLVEDHSFTHPHLPTLGERQLRHEVDASRSMLQAITGQPVDMFRPPFGEVSPGVLAQIRRAGMHEVMWGANSEDCWQFRAADIRHWATRQARDGAILLMHSRPTTAAALDATLTALERLGYRFVLPAGES